MYLFASYYFMLTLLFETSWIPSIAIAAKVFGVFRIGFVPCFDLSMPMVLDDV